MMSVKFSSRMDLTELPSCHFFSFLTHIFISILQIFYNVCDIINCKNQNYSLLNFSRKQIIISKIDELPYISQRNAISISSPHAKNLRVNLVLSAINLARIFRALTNTYGRFSRTVALLMHNDSTSGAGLRRRKGRGERYPVK